MEVGTKLNNVVKAILIKDKRARADDVYLYGRVCVAVSPDEAFHLTFVDWARFFNEFNFPKPESVRRTRQKLQHDFPELRPSKEIEMHRAEKEQDYLEYARS